MNKTILMLGVNTWEKEFAVKTALKMGLEIVIVSESSDSQIMRMADRVILCNPYNADETLDRIFKFSKTCPFDGVVGMTDYVLPTVSAIAREFGLTKLRTKPINFANDKYSFRQMLASEKLPHPRFYLIKGPDDLKKAAAHVGFPAILKPRALGGSVGVYAVKTVRQLEKKWKASFEDLRQWNYLMPYKNEFILEEQLEHKPAKGLPSGEMSIEVVSYGGRHYPIAFTDKRLISPDRPVEIQHIVPAAIPVDTKKRLTCTVNKVLSGCEVEWGVTHNELLVNDKTETYIETHLRPAGDRIIDLVYHSFGINMYEILIRLAIGERFKTKWIEPKWNKASTIKYFDFGRGLVKNLKSIEDLSIYPNVVDVEFKKRVGDKINPVDKNYFDRYGYFILAGPTTKKVIKTASCLVKNHHPYFA